MPILTGTRWCWKSGKQRQIQWTSPGGKTWSGTGAGPETGFDALRMWHLKQNGIGEPVWHLRRQRYSWGKNVCGKFYSAWSLRTLNDRVIEKPWKITGILRKRTRARLRWKFAYLKSALVLFACRTYCFPLAQVKVFCCPSVVWYGLSTFLQGSELYPKGSIRELSNFSGWPVFLRMNRGGVRRMGQTALPRGNGVFWERRLGICIFMIHNGPEVVWCGAAMNRMLEWTEEAASRWACATSRTSAMACIPAGTPSRKVPEPIPIHYLNTRHSAWRGRPQNKTGINNERHTRIEFVVSSPFPPGSLNRSMADGWLNWWYSSVLR